MNIAFRGDLEMKTRYLILFITILVAALAGPAMAQCASGSICVQVNDQFGNPVNGAVDTGTTVTIVTEGPDGVIDSFPAGDTIYPDLAIGATGLVELTSGTLTGTISDGGDYYYYIESDDGYVEVPRPAVGIYETYTASVANSDTEALLYTVKVTLQNQLSGSIDTDVSNSTVTIANSTNCNAAYADNGASDMDSPDTAGVIYLKCPPAATPENIDFTFSATGYIDDTALTKPLSRDDQLEVTSANNFSLMIPSGNIQDELGNNIVPADADPAGLFPTSDGSGGTINVVDNVASGGNVYVAAEAGGPSNLVIRYPGYIEASVAVTPTTTLQNENGIPAFTGASDLGYQIVINYAANEMEDELGTVLAFAAGDTFQVCTDGSSWTNCTGSALTVTSNQDGANWYLAPAAAPAAVYVGITKDGYVNQIDSTTVTTNWTAAVNPAFDGGTDGLPFGLKVIIRTELGGNIDPGTLDTLTFAGAPADADDGTNTAYFANTTAAAQALVIEEAGYVDASATNAGFASFDTTSTAQTVIDMQSGVSALGAVTSGTTNNALGMQYTLRVNAEDELGNVFTGGTVAQNGGSAVACTEDGVTGIYYCPVPDGETTAVTASLAGYVTASVVTAGAAAEAGPQIVQDLTDGSGDEVEFTLRVDIEDELANVITGATVAQNGGSGVTCTEDGATGMYYCAVPNGETTAVTAVKSGYISANVATAGAAAEAGPQTVQDLTDGSGNELLFTLRVELEDELGNVINTATVAQSVGSTVSCTEDGATGFYYCAVPDAEATDVTASKAGYITMSAASAGAASAAGPQVVQDMTDGTGSELQFTLKATIEDELANVFTGGTVAQNGGSSTACTEDGATGEYYCPVPDGETTALTASLAGYVTKSVVTAGNATVAGPQVTQDMTDGTGNEVQFTLRVEVEDELGNVLTGATVAQNGGSAVGCTEDGATGIYYCAVLDGETTAVTAAMAGYVTRTAATAGNAAVAGPQIVQDLTDGSGNEVQFTLRVNVEDEIGTVLTGATVAQNGGSSTACTEDGATGIYYCPVPNTETTAVTASKTGYVTSTVATAGAAATAGPQIVQDLTDGSGSEVQFTLRVDVEDELGNVISGATVAQSVGSTVTCTEEGVTGFYYCAVPDTEATDVTAAKAGYVTSSVATAGAAAEAGPQVVQDLTDGSGDEMLFTLRVEAEDELGNVFTGGTVAQSGGSAVSCTEDGATGFYYCPVPDTEATDVTAALDGYVTASVASAGAAAAAGPQVVQDLTDGTGNEVLFTLVVQAEDELGNVFTGGTVAQSVGSAVGCTEDGATGFYYCPVPNGEATDVTAAMAGYVTRSAATAGNAAAAGPQITQNLTDGTGNEVQFTLRVNVEDELGNVLTGATVAQSVGSTVGCTEDGATGFYYCAVPDGEATDVTAALAGYVTASVATAGNAAVAGPQVVQDLTDGSGNEVQFTLRVNAENEIGGVLTGATVSQNGGSGVACTEDGATGIFFCPVPNTETTAISVSKTGYISSNVATAGAAATAGPQVVQDLTDGGGNEILFTLRVEVEDELGNVINSATVAQNGGTGVSCAEDAATGIYYCAAPDGETTAVTAAKAGYVTSSVATAGAAAEAGPQTVQDLTDGSGDELQFTLVVQAEDELGNVFTGGTVAQNGGSSTACVEDGATGFYYCAVPNGETTAVTAALDGYVTASVATAGNAAEAGPQTTQDLTDGGGNEVLFTLVVQAEDELGNVFTAGAVAQSVGSTVACNEDGATGFYYCAVPNGEATDVTAAKAGYVTRSAATAGTAAAAGPQVVQNLTDGTGSEVQFTLRVNVESEVDVALTGATVVQNGGSAVACTEDGATGVYFCAVLNTETTAVAVSKTGYITTNVATAGAAATAGPQIVQDLTDGSGNEVQFTLRVNAEDELANIFTAGTVAQNGGSAVACVEDGVLGIFYCPVPNAEATAITASKTGYVTRSVATAGPAVEGGGPQVVQDLTDGSGNEVQFTLRVNVEDELGNVFTGATVAQNGGSAVSCAEDGALGFYYCAVPDTETTSVTVSRSGYITNSPATAGAAAEAGPQVVQDMTDGGGNEMQYVIVLSAAETEIGMALTPAAGDTMKLFTVSGCGSGEATYLDSTPTFDAGTSAWYIAVADGTYYAQFGQSGFINTCDLNTVAAAQAGAQANPTFTQAGGDGLPYVIKFSAAQDELGNAITLTAADTVRVYDNTANCGGAVAAYIAGPVWDAGTSAWYAAVADGTYYPYYGQTGYVNMCDATTVTVAQTGAQQSGTFTQAGGDGLQYGMRIITYDQFGQAVSGVTMTHGGGSPAYEDQGTDANNYYFNTSGAGQLVISKTGFQTIDTGAANVTPGGGAVAQLKVTLIGDSYGNLDTMVPIAGGDPPVTADGLRVQLNVELSVEDHNGAGITALGNFSNFYFYDGAARVTPDYFVEVDSVASPGLYRFKVPVTATTVQVKDVDYDGDPYIDFEDSSSVALTGLVVGVLTDYATATVYPVADFIDVVSTDGILEAGGTENLTINIYDNGTPPAAPNPAIISATAAPNSTRQVKLTISGGGSSTDITATTLSNATSIAGANDTTVTGDLIAGTAGVTIADSDVGNLTISIEPATGTLPQNASSTVYGSYALPIAVTAAAASQVVISEPTDNTVDNSVAVTIQVQDPSGNVVTTSTDQFTVNLDGSAVGASASTGTITAGTGTSAVAVQAANGVVVLNITDQQVETVNISLTDHLTTGLTMTSTKDVAFSYGAATQVTINNPTDQTVGTDTAVTARVLDQYGNLVANSTDLFSVVADGSATFTAATVGTLLGGANTNTAAVQAAGGLVTLTLSDTTAETVNLTLSDTSTTGYTMTSTQDVAYSPGNAAKLVFLSTTQTLTAGTPSSALYVQMQDSYGNGLGSVAADTSITLSSDSTAGTFAETSGGASVTSVTLTAASATDTVEIYYTDTTAGTPMITAAGTGVTSGTLTNTVNPAAAVSSVTFSTTQSGDDYVQSAAVTLGSFTIITYPYTDSGDVDDQITADGSINKITVMVKDLYGNARSGDTVSFSYSGATISPASKTTDSTGAAEFDISSTTIGTASIQTLVGGSNYGDSFSVIFKSDDRTPPTISTTTSASSLVNGDRISASDAININVALSDTGTNASGVDLTSIAVTVTNSSSVAVTGTTDTSNCTSESSCLVKWTPATTLSAGSYTVTMTVEDKNDNQQTQSWTVHVSGGTQLENVAAGSSDGTGVFNPLDGGDMVISFQSPAAGTAVLEIYRRDGRLVYTATGAITAGYNQIEWDGKSLTDSNLANGVYVFRISTQYIDGTGSEQTGKLAIFKK